MGPVRSLSVSSSGDNSYCVRIVSSYLPARLSSGVVFCWIASRRGVTSRRLHSCSLGRCLLIRSHWIDNLN